MTRDFKFLICSSPAQMIPLKYFFVFNSLGTDHLIIRIIKTKFLDRKCFNRFGRSPGFFFILWMLFSFKSIQQWMSGENMYINKLSSFSVASSSVYCFCCVFSSYYLILIDVFVCIITDLKNVLCGLFYINEPESKR